MRKLLFPFSFIYWIIISIRNLFFCMGILRSTSYKPKSIISIGNLSTGGTGKSPFTIYLCNLLKNDYKIAVVSRGYERESKGFKMATYLTKPQDIGDEATQLFNRFKTSILVAVDSSRRRAIAKLKELYKLDLFILDDAYQHRYVKRDINILLTDYNHRYSKDWILPMGDLREGRASAKRANIVVVTKSPRDISNEEKELIQKELKLKKQQHLFFSFINYSNKLIGEKGELDITSLKDKSAILITGIANTNHLLDYGKTLFQNISLLKFKDHQNYSKQNIRTIISEYRAKQKENKEVILITTEKDYVKLKEFNEISDIIYYLPIDIELDKPKEFEELIKSKIKKES